MDKKGVAVDYTIVWAIAIIVLVIIVASMILIFGRGQGYLEFLKDLFRSR